VRSRPSRLPRPLGVVARLLTVVLGLLVATALPAAAHTELTGTTPADGAVAATDAVVLTFTEPVTPVGTAISLRDAQGTDRTGPVTVDGPEVHVAVLPGGSGTHVLDWRVVASDGHPLTGTLAFSAAGGETAAAPAGGLAGLGAAGHASHATTPTAPDTAPALDTALAVPDTAPAATGRPRTLAVWRTVGVAGSILALLVLAGAALGEVGRHRRGTDGAARTVALPAAVAALVATVATLPAEAALLAGTGPSGGTSPDALAVLAATPAGTAAIARIVLLVAAVALLARSRRGGLALGTLAALTLPLAGHARAAGGVVLASDAVHVLAGAAWLGGLAVLAVRLRRGTARPLALADAVARFSRTAAVSVGALVASGFVLTVGITDLAALPGTAHGRALLAKTALAGVVLAVGAYNHRRLVPRVTAALTAPAAGASADVVPGIAAARRVASPAATRDAVALLRRTVLLELGGLAGVVALTAVLVDLSPGG
jgi:copper transport protein